MKQAFKAGDIKKFARVVGKEDTAAFESGPVHPVYSTFALARDAEWTCRLFVLEMKEADEEGIGTFITVNHQSPALEGEQVSFEAMVESINGNEIICSYKAAVNDRLIATGRQGQKILKKAKIHEIFDKLKHG
jgi:predicted thioesterase